MLTSFDRDILVHLIPPRQTSKLRSIFLGLGGEILESKYHVVDIINTLRSKFDLRSAYWYSNALFSLGGCATERPADSTIWFGELRRRILDPLGMCRTIASGSIHNSDSNISKPNMVMRSGPPVEVPPPGLSDRSLNGASGDIRSSANDVLSWCSAVLEARNSHRYTSEAPPTQKVIPSPYPFAGSTIIDPLTPEADDYCLGWVRRTTSTQLDQISPNRRFSSTNVTAAPDLLPQRRRARAHRRIVLVPQNPISNRGPVQRHKHHQWPIGLPRAWPRLCSL